MQILLGSRIYNELFAVFARRPTQATILGAGSMTWTAYGVKMLHSLALPTNGYHIVETVPGRAEPYAYVGMVDISLVWTDEIWLSWLRQQVEVFEQQVERLRFERESANALRNELDQQFLSSLPGSSSATMSDALPSFGSPYSSVSEPKEKIIHTPALRRITLE